MKHAQRGFTLVEIAIVLVIIGLLLGGILKGQELITSARVRNLANQIEGIKAAYFGFQDRYRGLPGDFKPIEQISNATQAGNADGQITGTEAIAVWDHLSHAGFINGTYTYKAAETTNDTTPSNPWNGRMQLIYDDEYAVETGTPTDRHNFKTGPQIPVEVLAELDRKIDGGDGALRGTLRFSAYAGGATAPTAANCYETGATNTGQWLAGTGEANCGAAILF